MPICYVPHCSSGYMTRIRYLKENNLPLPRFFSPRTEERRKIWEQSIKRVDRSLKMSDKVCSDHFLPEDVELEFRHNIQGAIHKLSRQRAMLKPTAVPQIFPNIPVHQQSKIRKKKYSLLYTKRIKIEPDTDLENEYSQNVNTTDESQEPKLEITEYHSEQEFHPTPAAVEQKWSPADEIGRRIEIKPDTDLENENPQNVYTTNTSQQPKLEITEYHSEQEFNPILAAVEQKWSPADVIKLQLPVGWVICNTVRNDKKVLVHINDQIVIDKSICFEHECPPSVVFRGHIRIDIDENFPKNLESVTEAQQVLNEVHNLKICQGTGQPEIPYSVSCIGAVRQRRKRCSFCMAEREKVQKKIQSLCKAWNKKTENIRKKQRGFQTKI